MLVIEIERKRVNFREYLEVEQVGFRYGILRMRLRGRQRMSKFLFCESGLLLIFYVYEVFCIFKRVFLRISILELFGFLEFIQLVWFYFLDGEIRVKKEKGIFFSLYGYLVLEQDFQFWFFVSQGNFKVRSMEEGVWGQKKVLFS